MKTIVETVQMDKWIRKHLVALRKEYGEHVREFGLRNAVESPMTFDSWARREYEIEMFWKARESEEA